ETYGIWGFVGASLLKGLLLFFIAPPESVTPIYVLYTAENVIHVVAITAVAAAAITAGNFLIYLIARVFGDRFLGEGGFPGEWILELALHRYTRLSMVVFRLIPVTGGIVAIPAGLVRVPLRLFLVYSFVGFFLYEAVFAFLAFYGIKMGYLPQLQFLAALVGPTA
ncbi:MAG: DedA family protein, partial [Candidatus Nanohaloarchaea archaeon]